MHQCFGLYQPDRDYLSEVKAALRGLRLRVLRAKRRAVRRMRSLDGTELILRCIASILPALLLWTVCVEGAPLHFKGGGALIPSLGGKLLFVAVALRLFLGIWKFDFSALEENLPGRSQEGIQTLFGNSEDPPIRRPAWSDHRIASLLLTLPQFAASDECTVIQDPYRRVLPLRRVRASLQKRNRNQWS